MKFTVQVQSQLTANAIALVIMLETGKILKDKKTGQPYEESFNVACEWPENRSDQAAVLTASLNSLITHAGINQPQKELTHE